MARDERLHEIVRILSSYGLRFLYHNQVKPSRKDQDPENLRLAFEKLGPSFIKIGQILSTRIDILPQAFVEELAHLQDKAPEFPFAEVERIFMEETKLSLGEAFLSIDEKPLASASIAQVHRAVLRTGEEVVVKVQRPIIDDLLIRDLDILIRLSGKIPKELVEVVDPKEALEQVKANTLIELDFRNEAQLLQRFRDLNANIACVGVPKIYPGLTTRRVLVEEYIEGTKITNREQLDLLGYDADDISRKLMLAYLKQVFHDGFFHGDPHPGNLIIKEGKIYFIDFGIMGDLSEPTKKSLNDILQGLAAKDLDRMVKVCLELGTPKGRVDKRNLYADVEMLFDMYLSNNMLNVNLGTFITDFIRMFKRHNIAIPSDLTILAKSLSILEGVFLEISPELNLISIAKDYLKESFTLTTLLQKFSAEKLALRGYAFIKDSSEIPSSLLALLKQTASGRTMLRIDVDQLDDKWKDVKKMSNRVVISLIVAGLLLSSAIMSGTPGGQFLGQAGFVIAGLFSIWLLISIFRSGNL